MARDIDAYQRLIDGLLEREIGIARYFTYIVTRTVKEEAVLPVAELLAAASDSGEIESDFGAIDTDSSLCNPAVQTASVSGVSGHSLAASSDLPRECNDMTAHFARPTAIRRSTASPIAACCANSPMSTDAGRRARPGGVSKSRSGQRRKPRLGRRARCRRRRRRAIDAAAARLPGLAGDAAAGARDDPAQMVRADPGGKGGSGAADDAGAGQAAGRSRAARSTTPPPSSNGMPRKASGSMPRASPAICPAPR